MLPLFSRLRAVWIEAVCLCCFVFFVFYSLPFVIEKSVIPLVFSRLAIADYTFEIFRLRPFGCDFWIQIGSSREQIISSGVVHISWTPAGILNKEIEEVVVRSAYIHLPISVETPDSISSQKSAGILQNGGKKKTSLDFPVVLHKFSVEDATLSFFLNGKECTFPFSTELSLVSPVEQISPSTLKYNIVVSHHHRSNELKGTLKIVSNTATVELRLNGLIDPFTLHEKLFYPLPGGIQGTFSEIQPGLNTDLRVDFSTRDKSSLRWSCLTSLPLLKSQESPRLQISFSPGRGEYSGEVEMLSFTSHGNLTEINGKLKASVANNRLRENDNFFNLKRCDIESNVRVHLQGDKKVNITLDVHGLEGEGSRASQMLVLHDFSFISELVGEEILSKEKLTQVIGNVSVHDASLTDSEEKLTLDGVQFTLPFKFPFSTRDTASVRLHPSGPGSLQVSDILLRGRRLGSLDLNLKQEKRGLGYNGRFDMKVLPGLVIDINGSTKATEEDDLVSDITYSRNDYALSLTDMAPFVPALHNVKGSGSLQLQGHTQIQSGRVNNSLKVSVNDMEVRLPEDKVVLKNIKTLFFFPNLPRLQTAPQQSISIDSIKAGKLSVSDVKFDYRIESQGSFFVEKSQMDWAGGRLYTGGFRINPQEVEVDTDFYCDRVVLAELLNQFGLAGAKGKGSISGRIPVSFHAGHLGIEEGFLYSTPGKTQRIKITGSDYFPSSIPKKPGELVSPLHFAGAALTDFEYDWAKLLLNTENDNLRLELRVYGKPAAAMPFRFDNARRGFVRLSGEQQATIRQPLKLDVNFNVPVNDLLDQRDIMMPLLNSVQTKERKP